MTYPSKKPAKPRFRPYTLVKIYHPDKCGLCNDGLHRRSGPRGLTYQICLRATVEKVRTVLTAAEVVV